MVLVLQLFCDVGLVRQGLRAVAQKVLYDGCSFWLGVVNMTSVGEQKKTGGFQASRFRFLCSDTSGAILFR